MCFRVNARYNAPMFATDLTPYLTAEQKLAVHLFNERGRSIASQDDLEAENQRLKEENAQLKAILQRIKQRAQSRRS